MVSIQLMQANEQQPN